GAIAEIRGELLAKKAEALNWLGEHRRAVEASEQALALLPERSEASWRALKQIALAATWLLGAKELERVIAPLAVRTESELAMAMSVEAACLVVDALTYSDVERARSAFERLVSPSIDRMDSVPRTRGRIAATAGLLSHALGDFSRAVSKF